MESFPARAAWCTLRGRRSANHDDALVHHLGRDRLLVAVADGMGGHRAGGEASRRALERLRDSVDAGKTLAEAVESANAAVYEEGNRTAAHAGMGTTLVVFLAEGDGYRVANVGDSRAYRVDDRGIRQITDDHSFAAEALANGALTEEELADSPWRNSLTRAVGTDPEVAIDLFGPFPSDPPHCVLLCTDGLYRALPDARMREIVRTSADPESTCRRLSELAYEAGATDNITAAVISVGPAARDAGSRDRKPVVRSTTPLRLTHKKKVELGVAAVTLLLAMIAAFAILGIL